MVIDINGNVWATGYNLNGQLGVGDSNTQILFVTVLGITNAVSVYCGNTNAIITLKDGSRWGAGSNYQGKLGLSKDIESTSLFMPIHYLPKLNPIHKRSRT